MEARKINIDILILHSYFMMYESYYLSSSSEMESNHLNLHKKPCAIDEKQTGNLTLSLMALHAGLRLLGPEFLQSAPFPSLQGYAPNRLVKVRCLGPKQIASSGL